MALEAAKTRAVPEVRTTSRALSSGPSVGPVLVVRPYSGTRELYKIVIWISEVNAPSSPFPKDLRFDFDTPLAEPRLPSREFVAGDSKSKMPSAKSVVGRNNAMGDRNWIVGSTLREEQ